MLWSLSLGLNSFYKLTPNASFDQCCSVESLMAFSEYENRNVSCIQRFIWFPNVVHWSRQSELFVVHFELQQAAGFHLCNLVLKRCDCFSDSTYMCLFMLLTFEIWWRLSILHANGWPFQTLALILPNFLTVLCCCCCCRENYCKTEKLLRWLIRRLTFCAIFSFV